MAQSPKGTLNREDVKKTFIHFSLAVVALACSFGISIIPHLNLGEYSYALMPFILGILELIQKTLAGLSKEIKEN